MKTISWITPEYFVETDIYVVPSLSYYYNIEWNIVYAKNVPFREQLESSKRKSLKIHYWQIPNISIFSPKMFMFYYKLLNSVVRSKTWFIYSAILNYPFLIAAFLILPKHKTTFAAHNVITPKGSKRFLFTKIYINSCYKYYDNFQTFSESQFNMFNQIYPGKNVLLAPFVMKDYGQVTNDVNDNITFLFFGRIMRYKCPEVVIDASQKVSEQTKIPFKVIIAGECSEWYKYERLITKPKLFDLRIHSIPNEDIPNLFGESHYTLLPYKDIAQSGALFVSINYAKPSILSRLPAFEEVLTDNDSALFINKPRTEELAAKMKYVLESHNQIYPALRQNLEIIRDSKYCKANIVEKYKYFINQFV